MMHLNLIREDLIVLIIFGHKIDPRILKYLCRIYLKIYICI